MIQKEILQELAKKTLKTIAKSPNTTEVTKNAIREALLNPKSNFALILKNIQDSSARN